MPVTGTTHTLSTVLVLVIYIMISVSPCQKAFLSV